jgi:hypothetical protein
MTEAEWLGGFALMSMLDFVTPKASDRKFRLFACGCCRIIWPLLVCDESRAAVERAEEYADGRATLGELTIAQERENLAWFHIRQIRKVTEQEAWASGVVRQASFPGTKSEYVVEAAKQAAKYSWSTEQAGQGQHPNSHDNWCQMVRCVFGNPFRPVTADPRWLTSSVVTLAQTMYDSRDFTPIPILADALEEAGCDNADVLAHCRGPGPHVRGCWVVDLLLGKT